MLAQVVPEKDEMTARTPKLKPCPFCGAKPKHHYNENLGGHYEQISHARNCYFHMAMDCVMVGVHFFSLADRRAWNRRTKP